MIQHSQRLRKSQRLLSPAQYRAVFTGAQWKSACEHFLLLALPGEGHSRFGLVVAKKNVRLAVQRNRIKRLVREKFRTGVPCPIAMDIVFVARRGIADLDNTALRQALDKQWQRLERRASQLAEPPTRSGKPCVSP